MNPSQPDNIQVDPFQTLQENNVALHEFSDGSGMLEDLTPDYNENKSKGHYENLADGVLAEGVVSQVGYELIEGIEKDIQSQQMFFDSLAKVINLMGTHLLTGGNKDDLPFKGASEVYSMALYETWLDMLSTAMSTIFPRENMVDTVITGEANDQLRDIAYRKKTWFMYYFDNIAKEFRKEAQKTLGWAIVAGKCYKKIFIDPVLQRPVGMYIRPEDFIVNKEYSSLSIAKRKTQILHLTKKELKTRIANGEYRDVPVFEQSMFGDMDSPIQQQLDDTTGVSDDGDDEDDYILYECHSQIYIKEDPKSLKDKQGKEYEIPLSYIATIDEKSGNVLKLVRNWAEEDPNQNAQEYFVCYTFLPSLDGEGEGLVNYAGRLAEAATSVQRQLINAGTYANFPGGLIAAGTRIENNNLRPAPGEFIPLKTALPIDQIVKPLPYKEPSPALKELLDKLEDTIRKPSAIINQKIAEWTPRAPMGSLLLMFESLQRVPNSIIEDFHASFSEELSLWNQRFYEWIPEGNPYPFSVPGGQQVIMKQDFDPSILVVPGSDPAMQNSGFRFMQSEIVLNQAHASPEIHNMFNVYQYFYKNMGLSPDDIGQMLVNPQANQPKPLDPITENQNILTGKGVAAGIMQDHDAHMTVHQLIAADPNAQPQQMQAAIAHINEHKALKFSVQMQQQIGFQMPQDPSQIPPEEQNKIAVAAAQQAQQMLQQMHPPAPPEPPLDPARVMLEDVQQKAVVAAQKNEIEKLKLELELKEQDSKHSLEIEKLHQKNEIDLLKIQLEEQRTQLEYAYKNRDLQAREHKGQQLNFEGNNHEG